MIRKRQQLFIGVLYSQENVFECIKFLFIDHHRQKLKASLSTNSIGHSTYMYNIITTH